MSGAKLTCVGGKRRGRIDSGFPRLQLLTMWSAVSGVRRKLVLADLGGDGLVQEDNVATRISPLFTSAHTST